MDKLIEEISAEKEYISRYAGLRRNASKDALRPLLNK